MTGEEEQFLVNGIDRAEEIAVFRSQLTAVMLTPQAKAKLFSMVKDEDTQHTLVLYAAGYSEVEIANALKVSVTTVNRRIRLTKDEVLIALRSVLLPDQSTKF